MKNLIQQSISSDFFRRNKAFILLLFAWVFRLCFLLQSNVGGGLNKFVFLQIALMLGLFAMLLQKRVLPTVLRRLPPTRMFFWIYVMGMISIAWSVMPLLSCYFAFENMVCMTVLLYLGGQCRDKFQLERVFIWMVISIIGFFIARTVLIGGDWHSVTYSTIGAMLFTYCLAEYSPKTKPPENMKVIKYGAVVGGSMLLITTSSGALVSTAVSLFALALCAERKTIRVLALLVIVAFWVMWFNGMTETLMNILFPGKTEAGVLTAHGRSVIWKMINEKVAERPWLGWGYAVVERILPIYCVDAHNSIVGIRGSLGNIGCGILIFAMLQLSFFFFRNTAKFGFRGIFVATFCAFINSNSSNFLVGKAGPASLVFQFLLVMGAIFLIMEQRNLQADMRVTSKR